MNKFKNLFMIMLITILGMLVMPTSVFATKFDDTYCEKTFKGENLWTSNINSNKFYGQKLDSSSGVYTYDWVHQIWDEDHEQLYTQERYTMTVNMKPILVNNGEMLDSMSYSLKVDATSAHSKLTSEYSSINDIKTPDGYKRMEITASGYDAVYIYTEGKSEGNGNGIVSQAYNRGTIYIPIVDTLNDTGKIFTLEITATMNGESFSLYDSMIGTYINTITALPCTINIEKEEKVFKKGASVTNASNTSSATSEEKSFPIVPIVAITAAGCGAYAVIKKKKSPVKNVNTKISNTPEQPKSENEIKREKYIEKLKEKYGEEDEIELKKEIMKKQIYNEKQGYNAQKDMAWSDAALDTAESSKTVTDISADIIGEFGGAKGKAFKNIYTGLTEAAEAAGQIMAGEDASKAITEAVLDTSVGVIQNESNGLRQKLASNGLGGAAKEFAKTYMNTDGDIIESIDAANEAIIEGSATATFDSLTDVAVDKAISKSVTKASKKVAKKTLEEGVNASKAFAQDMIKNSAKEAIKK